MTELAGKNVKPIKNKKSSNFKIYSVDVSRCSYFLPTSNEIRMTWIEQRVAAKLDMKGWTWMSQMRFQQKDKEIFILTVYLYRQT